MPRKFDVQRADGSKRMDKVNLNKDGNHELIHEAKKRDKGKVLLKIKQGLYVAVSPEYNNEEYRKEYLKKLTL